MAFVVKRRDGRFEVRESVTTPAGPRSRTLVTFRNLSDDVLARAESRASRPFDRDTVATRARQMGASDDASDALHSAHRLLVELESGRKLPEGLARLLADRLAPLGAAVPDSIPPVTEWLAASPRARGDALRDLLRMTDRLPRTSARPRRHFPRIASARA